MRTRSTRPPTHPLFYLMLAIALLLSGLEAKPAHDEDNARECVSPCDQMADLVALTP